MGGGETRAYVPLFTQDAMLLIVVALLGVPVLLLRAAVESRTRTVQVAPAVLGLIAVLQWLGTTKRQASLLADTRDRWVSAGDLGPTLVAIGTVAFCLAGIFVTIQRWRRNGVVVDPFGPLVTRRSLVRAVIQTVGALIGFVVAIIALLNIHVPPPFDALSPIVFIAGPVCGGALGLFAGYRLGDRLLPDAP